MPEDGKKLVLRRVEKEGEEGKEEGEEKTAACARI